MYLYCALQPIPLHLLNDVSSKPPFSTASFLTSSGLFSSAYKHARISPTFKTATTTKIFLTPLPPVAPPSRLPFGVLAVTIHSQTYGPVHNNHFIISPIQWVDRAQLGGDLFHVVSVVGFWGLHWARMAQGRWLVLAAGWGVVGRRGPPLSPPCGWSMLPGLLSARWLGSRNAKAARPS